MLRPYILKCLPTFQNVQSIIMPTMPGSMAHHGSPKWGSGRVAIVMPGLLQLFIFLQLFLQYFFVTITSVGFYLLNLVDPKKQVFKTFCRFCNFGHFHSSKKCPNPKK